MTGKRLLEMTKKRKAGNDKEGNLWEGNRTDHLTD
jgi:hypothetical protein